MCRVFRILTSRTWRDFSPLYGFMAPDLNMCGMPRERKGRRIVVGKRRLGGDGISVPTRSGVGIAQCCGRGRIPVLVEWGLTSLSKYCVLC